MIESGSKMLIDNAIRNKVKVIIGERSAGNDAKQLKEELLNLLKQGRQRKIFTQLYVNMVIKDFLLS